MIFLLLCLTLLSMTIYKSTHNVQLNFFGINLLLIIKFIDVIKFNLILINPDHT